MGKLVIEGKASKEYSYDLMEISVKFWAEEGAVATALKKVTQQSEEFLKILDAAGVKVEGIHIGEDSTEKERYSEKFKVNAVREFTICVPFNMDFLNYIRDVIQKNAFDAKIKTEYKFSDIDSIHKELIQMALLDSKEKAEYITRTMGQKVTGIENVEIGNSGLRRLMDKPLCGPDEGSYYDELLAILSRRVQAPTSIESEQVRVEWLIE